MSIKSAIKTTIAASNPYAAYLEHQAGGPMWAIPGMMFNGARNAMNGVKSGYQNILNRRMNGSASNAEANMAQETNNISNQSNDQHNSGMVADNILKSILSQQQSTSNSLKQGFERVVKLLESNSKENEDMKKHLQEISKKEEVRNKIEEQREKNNSANRQSGQGKASSLSHPLSKNIVTMTNLLERIAHATEDLSKIAKLSVGLGENANVKASAIQSAVSSLDPTRPGGMNRKEWHTNLLDSQKAVEKLIKSVEASNARIADALAPMAEEARKNIDYMNNSWKQKAFNMLKRGGMAAGALGLAAGAATAKASWNHVIRPFGEEQIAHFKLAANAKNEKMQADALKKYAEAVKSGNPEAIKKAKIVLTKHGISDMMANFAGQGGDPKAFNMFNKRLNAKDKAVPFDTQTREAIITGIPLLLSKILKALNGEDAQWNYEMGRLTDSDTYVQAKMAAAKQKNLNIAANLRSKNFLFRKKEQLKNIGEAQESVDEIHIGNQLYNNTLGRTNLFKPAMNTIDQDFEQNGMKNHSDILSAFKEGKGSVAINAGYDAIKASAKFVFKQIMVPAVKMALSAIFVQLDQTKGGRDFFKNYIKPNLPKSMSHLNGFEECMWHIEAVFPYFIQNVKQVLQDIKDGKKSILEPIGEAMKVIFRLENGKPSKGTEIVLKILDAAINITAGTAFDSVAKAAEWIRSNFLDIVQGKHEGFKKAMKTANFYAKTPFRTTREKISQEDMFERLAGSDYGNLSRLLMSAGLSEKEVNAHIGKLTDSKEVGSISLMDKLSGKSFTTNSVNNTNIDITPLMDIMSNSYIHLKKIADSDIINSPVVKAEIKNVDNSEEIKDISRKLSSIYLKLDDLKVNIVDNKSYSFKVESDIVPSLNTFYGTSYWSTLESTIRSAIGKSLNIKKGGSIIGSSIGGLGHIGGSIIDVLIGSIKGIFTTITTTGSLIKNVAKGLAWGFEFLFKGLDKIGIFALVKESLLKALNGIGHTLKAIFDGIVGTLKRIPKALELAAKGIYKAGEFIVDTAKTTTKVVISALNMIKNATSKVWGGFKKFFGFITNPLSWLKDKISSIFNFLTGGLKKAWGAVKSGGKKVAGFFGFGKEGKELNQNRYLRLIATYTRATYENLSILLKSKGLTPARAKLVASSAAGEMVSNVVGGVKAAASKVTNFFSNSLEKIKEKLKEKRERQNTNYLKSIAKSTGHLDKQFGKYWGWQKLKNFFGNLGGIFSTGIGAITNMLGGMMSLLGGLLGIGGGPIRKVLSSAGSMIANLAKGAVSMGSKALRFATMAGGALMPAVFKNSEGGVKGALKVAGKIGKQALKAIPGVGLVVAGVDALYGGFNGWNNAANIHGLKQGQEASLTEKTSAALGGAVGSLASIVDLIPGSGLLANALGFESIEDMVTKGVAKVAKVGHDLGTSAMSSVFGILTGSGARNAVVSKYRGNVIEANVMKIERINDYNKFKNIPARDIKYMLDYGFTNPKDAEFAQAVLAEKESKGESTKGYFEEIGDKISGFAKTVADKALGFLKKITNFFSDIFTTIFAYIYKGAKSLDFEIGGTFFGKKVGVAVKFSDLLPNFMKEAYDKKFNSGASASLSSSNNAYTEKDLDSALQSAKAVASNTSLAKEHNATPYSNYNNTDINSTAYNSNFSSANMVGSIKIADAPNVFTNMLSVLQKIEQNTRINYTGVGDRIKNSSNNSSREQEIDRLMDGPEVAAGTRAHNNDNPINSKQAQAMLNNMKNMDAKNKSAHPLYNMAQGAFNISAATLKASKDLSAM